MCDCHRGDVLAYHRQLINVSVQALGWSFGFLIRQQGIMICDIAVSAPKTVSWPLDLGAVGPSWSPSTSPCAPAGAHESHEGQ